MALPNASTINNIYINGVLNPQWNDNGGSFGLDPMTGLPFVIATPSPSYFNASQYNFIASSFAAKIVPVLTGTGTMQTSLVVKADKNNYVEMHVGPDNIFSAYISTGGVPTVVSSPFPAYNSVSHAYWRIRNDIQTFYFETSPDGATWTVLGNLAATWDASTVSVTFFAGFTGQESPNQKAFISSINSNTVSTVLSAHARTSSYVRGTVVVTNPNALSGKVSGFSNRQAKFHLGLGIPQGGLTDFTISNPNDSDPIRSRIVNLATATSVGGTGGIGPWVRSYSTNSVPTAYRDGIFWAKATGVLPFVEDVLPNDNLLSAFTNVQVEKAQGPYNKLSVTASYYTDSCEYAPATAAFLTVTQGTDSVTRSTDIALAGNYSGKMHFNGTAITDSAGNFVYWAYPGKGAVAPVINNVLGQETLRGTVYFSTQRANTQWYATFFFYDANFNILPVSSLFSATIPNMNTHPGGGVWQQGVVNMPTSGTSTARWVAIVPVVKVAGATAPQENTYMTGHNIVGITPAISSYPSPYEAPETLKITLKPDRLNYATNAGFNSDTVGWNAKRTTGITGTDVMSVSWDGTTGFNSVGSMKVAVAAPGGGWSTTPTGKEGPISNILLLTAAQPIIIGLKIGHTYNFSARVFQGPGCPDIFMNITDANDLGIHDISLNNIKNTKPSESTNGWVRIQTTYTVPPTSNPDFRYWFYVTGPDIAAKAPFNFWIDSLLVEETTNPAGDFFDGNFSSPDYQFELQGNQNNRSYYYKDFTNKLARVKTIIPRYAPVNTTFQILTAQPPV